MFARKISASYKYFELALITNRLHDSSILQAKVAAMGHDPIKKLTQIKGPGLLAARAWHLIHSTSVLLFRIEQS